MRNLEASDFTLSEDGAAPGQYQFRATVRQGASAAQEMISVTIE